MTPTPVFLTYKKPIKTICDLAELVEAKFGINCTLVGKAVALIGMLAREFVFIFHEGASSYVKHSRKLHMLLNQRCGLSLKFNPILRVRYKAWDSLSVACSWFQLPEPFRNAFGTEELCAASFAGRWKEVAAEQEKLLAELGRLRRPVDLIGFLDNRLGGNWRGLAKEYGELQQQLEKLHSEVDVIRAERSHLYDERRNIRQRTQCLQKKAGDHFRAHIFEKESVAPEHDAQRKQHLADLDEVIHAQRLWKGKMADLRKRQQELVRDTRIVKIHDRRRAIELEAELKRLRLIRQAVISSKGLQRAAFRPSAWWFPLVCPDGLWYRETIESADYYLEPLQ